MRSFSSFFFGHRQSSGSCRIRTDTAKLCWNHDGGNLLKRQWFAWCGGWQGKTLTPLFPDYFSSGLQMLPRKHSDTWHLTLRLAKIPPRAFVTLGWNYGLLDVCNVQNANNAKRSETEGGGGGGGGPLNKERKGQEEQLGKRCTDSDDKEAKSQWNISSAKDQMTLAFTQRESMFCFFSLLFSN